MTISKNSTGYFANIPKYVIFEICFKLDSASLRSLWASSKYFNSVIEEMCSRQYGKEKETNNVTYKQLLEGSALRKMISAIKENRFTSEEIKLKDISHIKLIGDSLFVQHKTNNVLHIKKINLKDRTTNDMGQGRIIDNKLFLLKSSADDKNIEYEIMDPKNDHERTKFIIPPEYTMPFSVMGCFLNNIYISRGIELIHLNTKNNKNINYIELLNNKENNEAKRIDLGNEGEAKRIDLGNEGEAKRIDLGNEGEAKRIDLGNEGLITECGPPFACDFGCLALRRSGGTMEVVQTSDSKNIYPKIKLNFDKEDISNSYLKFASKNTLFFITTKKNGHKNVESKLVEFNLLENKVEHQYPSLPLMKFPYVLLGTAAIIGRNLKNGSEVVFWDKKSRNEATLKIDFPIEGIETDGETLIIQTSESLQFFKIEDKKKELVETDDIVKKPENSNENVIRIRRAHDRRESCVKKNCILN